MKNKLKENQVEILKKHIKQFFPAEEVDKVVNNAKKTLERILPDYRYWDFEPPKIKILDIEKTANWDFEIITNSWTFLTTKDLSSWIKLPSSWPMAWRNVTWHYVSPS